MVLQLEHARHSSTERINPGETRLSSQPTELAIGGSKLFVLPYIAQSERDGIKRETPRAIVIDQDGNITDTDAATTVGRTPFINDLVLKDARVSRSHATIHPTLEGAEIQDLGSSNGIDMAEIGELFEYHNFHLESLKPHVPFTPGKLPIVIRMGEQRIRIKKDYRGNDFILDPDGKKYYFQNEPHKLEKITIGRESDNDIVINNSNVSGKHLEVLYVDGVCIIRDLGSANGAVVHVGREKKIEKSDENESTQKKEVTRELIFWEFGHHSLQKRQELEKKYDFDIIDVGGTRFVVPGYAADIIFFHMIPKMRAVEKAIGGEVTDRKRINVLLVPEQKYFPSASGICANGGEHILVNLEEKGLGLDANKFVSAADMVFAHEYAHAWLMQLYGESNSDTFTEGAAEYFTEQTGSKVANFMFGLERKFGKGIFEAIKLERQDIPVGVSHTEMLQRAGNFDADTEQKYQHSYRFGRYLAEYLINTVGKEAYLTIYKYTCDNRLIGMQEREVIKWAMERARQELNNDAINMENISKGFDQYIKRRSGLPLRLIGKIQGFITDYLDN